MSLRQDAGQLQNFLMAARVKQLAYAHISANQYFWRTTAQQEVDYVEERDGLMQAFEFRWNPKARAVTSSTFLNAYPGSTTAVIHPENAAPWLMQAP